MMYYLVHTLATHEIQKQKATIPLKSDLANSEVPEKDDLCTFKNKS